VRTDRRLALVLFLVALAARIAFLALEPRTRLVADERSWLAAADELRSPAVRFDPLRSALAFYPPLHPYFLALGRELTGGTSGAKLLQCLLGALLAPVVLAVATRTFDRRVGVAAGLLAALYPELVWHSAHLWSEPLFMVLLWGAIALVFAADADGRLGTAAAAGLLFGLAALTRDPALYFVPLAALWLAVRRPPGRSWRLAAALAAATVLVVLPWSVRNWARFRAPIPVSLMGARTFWEGAARQHQEVIDAYAALEQAQGPLAAYRVAWREGLAATRARQPWWLLEQVRDQMPRFWTAVDTAVIHLERGAYRDVPPWAARAVLAATALPHVLVTAAFLVGLAALPLTRARGLLLVFLAYYLALHVATVGHPRLRLPLLPVVFVYAAAAVVETRTAGLHWTKARFVVAGLLLAAFAACLALDVPATLAEPVFGWSSGRGLP